MINDIERLYAMADECLAKELGEGRWVTDEDGDRVYTQVAQDKFDDITVAIDEVRYCYWEGPFEDVVTGAAGDTSVWVLRGHREGEEASLYLFKSQELAEEGLKELFADEYWAYQKLELDISFRDFLEEFCE